jgi:hypothetical protein
VPAIAIFTKYDGLLTEAFSELKNKQGLGDEDAHHQAPNRAFQMLTANFQGPLKKAEFPPSDFVCLAGDSYYSICIQKDELKLSTDRYGPRMEQLQTADREYGRCSD